MSYKLPNTYISSHFYELAKTKARYVVAFGGRGSGKTHAIALKLLIIALASYYNKVLYVNKEFRHIKTQQYSTFKKVAKSIKFTNGTSLYDMFTWYNGDYRIVCKNGNEIIPVGMDDFEKTKGIDDPTIIWWDEINKGTLDDFLALNALLRTPLNPQHQFIISFNPVSEKHWLRSYFFKENNAYELKDEFENSYLNHSTYLNNDFLDKEAYLKTLEQNALGNTNRMLVDIQGRWGVLDLQNLFLYSFNKEKNFINDYYNLEYGSDLILSFDFNKSPCTLLIIHIDKKRYVNAVDLMFADDNTMDNATPLEALCRKFNEKYKGVVTSANLIITGDASGKSGGADKKKNHNFFTTIQYELLTNKYQTKTRKSNISHKESQEICNTFIYNCGFRIYKSAEKLIDEIEIAYMSDTVNGQSLDKAKKEHGLHAFDTLRYGIDCVLDFKNWQSNIEYYRQNKI